MKLAAHISAFVAAHMVIEVDSEHVSVTFDGPPAFASHNLLTGTDPAPLDSVEQSQLAQLALLQLLDRAVSDLRAKVADFARRDFPQAEPEGGAQA